MTLKFGPPDVLTIPSIVTSRLILRGWCLADVDPYLAMAQHPDMSLYTGSPSKVSSVWAMTAFQIGHADGPASWPVPVKPGRGLGRPEGDDDGPDRPTLQYWSI